MNTVQGLLIVPNEPLVAPAADLYAVSLGKTDWAKAQKLVCGYLEPIHVVYEGQRAVLLVPDDGRLKKLAVNGVASAVAKMCGFNNRLIGRCLVFGEDRVGDWLDVPPGLVELIKRNAAWCYDEVGDGWVPLLDVPPVTITCLRRRGHRRPA